MYVTSRIRFYSNSNNEYGSRNGPSRTVAISSGKAYESGLRMTSTSSPSCIFKCLISVLRVQFCIPKVCSATLRKGTRALKIQDVEDIFGDILVTSLDFLIRESSSTTLMKKMVKIVTIIFWMSPSHFVYNIVYQHRLPTSMYPRMKTVKILIDISAS